MRIRGRASLAAMAGVVALLAPTPAFADHHGGPSAADVAASKARVRQLERQVAHAADAVNAAQSRLESLRTQAEVAVEAYDRAQVTEAAAAQALDAAQLVLAAAQARVTSVRGQVTRFAVAAYEGGTLSSVDALLTARGPDTMLQRLETLDAVSRSQRDVLQAMTAASVYQHVVQQQAAQALQHAHAAADAADHARQHARDLVATQTAAVGRLAAAQHDLGRLLTQAKAHATAVERARLAAIARARAEAAAAAAARRAAAAKQSLQGVGTSPQEFTSTVSASTELDALHEAETQIGKPYEWGAAGPDTYDCSGLVMWSYAQVGVHVDHWTGDQWNEGAHIPIAALRPGDLLFFATDTSNPDTIHHVGIYAGDGEMVEAPYTGANVRISPAFRPDLIGAVRLYNR